MERTRIGYYRAVFYSGAVFNVIAATVFAFAFGTFYELLGGETVPDIPLLHLFTDLTALAILLFSPVYFFAGYWLEKEESNLLIALGAVGKILFFSVVFSYAVAGLTFWSLVWVGVIDLVYAALFIECLLYKSSYRKRLNTATAAG
jgi:hypothetical protein